MVEDPQPFVIKPDEVESFHPPHHEDTSSVELVNPDRGSEHVTFRITTAEPGATDTWHAHSDSEQLSFIRRGKQKMWIGEPGDDNEDNAEEYELTPNSFVFLPKNTYHRMEVIGEDLCEEIVIWAPPYQSLEDWAPENN